MRREALQLIWQPAERAYGLVNNRTEGCTVDPGRLLEMLRGRLYF